MQEGHIDPLIGTVLAERYRIQAMMSQGGFGKVYRAEHVTIGRLLAVKVLSAKGYGHDDDDARRRFLSEARATSQIRHSNVIDILDYGHTDSGLAFYVMELLDGEDLAAMLRRGGPLPWSRLGPMVTQICGALAAAHRLGIVHRDIKPANCFRIEVEDNPDFIKVLDFGIAKNYAPPPGMDVPRTATHALMGTPFYMAPESAAGSPADERSDIYSLGVVMYELATGARPVTGVDFVNILFNHCHSELIPPRSLAVDLPEAAERIILRALSKKPEARQQSMRELQEEVRRSLAVPTGGMPVLGPAQPATQPRPSPAPVDPHAMDTTVAAALGAAPAVVPVVPTVVPAQHPLDSPTLSNQRPRRLMLPSLSAVSAVSAIVVLWMAFNRGDAVDETATPPVLANRHETAPATPPEPDRRKLPHTDPKPVDPPTPLAPPTSLPTPTSAPAPAPPTPKKTATRPSDHVPSVKKSPQPQQRPAAVPAFSATKAEQRLRAAVEAGATKCYVEHNAPSGFDFAITVTVTPEGAVQAAGKTNSPLRRCLLELTKTTSLDKTTTGGEFQFTFSRV
jgi:serine/threonine protein kinase